MVALNFNPQGITPAFGYGAGSTWNDGWKKVVITNDDVRDNNDKTSGQHLGLTLKCLESQNPEDVGQEGYLAINLYHAKPDVRARAEQQLTALLAVLGLGGMTHTEQLHNIPFWVENKCQSYTPPGATEAKRRNNFVSVRDLNGNEPGKGAPVAAVPSLPPMPPAPPQQGFGAPPQAAPGFGAPAAGAPQAGFAAPTGQPQGFPGTPTSAPAPSFAPPTGQPPAGFPQQPNFAPPAGNAPAFPSSAPPQGFGAPAQPGQPMPPAGPGWGPPQR